MKKIILIITALIGIGVMSSVYSEEIAVKSTLENLKFAYNKESNDKAHYETFANRADEEGYVSFAALFRALVKSENVLATQHLSEIKKMGGETNARIENANVKTTMENLESAMKDAVNDKETMYSVFFEKAKAENNEEAAISFKRGMTSEASHTDLLNNASSELESWKVPGKTFLVCTVCGFTTMDTLLQKCPACAAPRSKFE